jgi:hypothetical protein
MWYQEKVSTSPPLLYRVISVTWISDEAAEETAEEVDRLLGVRWMPEPVPEKVCITGRFIFRRTDDFSDPVSEVVGKIVSGPWVREIEISSKSRSTGKKDSSSNSNQTSEPEIKDRFKKE